MLCQHRLIIMGGFSERQTLGRNLTCRGLLGNALGSTQGEGNRSEERGVCCCCSFAQSCPTLYDSMDCSTPGFPVHHQLPELTQTHAHRVGDAIQPSHPLSPLFPPVPKSRSFPMSQLFAWGGQSIGVSASASVLPRNIQDWFPLGWTGLFFL